jgi:hypothetical protein
MRIRFLVALVLLIHLFGAAAEATVQKSVKTPVKKQVVRKNGQAQLGTSFRFNPNALEGKRQMSPNLTATVENDKYLDNLLAPRKSFKDRIEQDKQRD